MNTRLFFIIFFLLGFSIVSVAQDESTSSEDTTEYEDFSSLMINASYTNNNLEYLNGTSDKIPTLFTNISFFHKSGFYAALGYSNYFSDSIQSSDYDIEVGYQKYFDNGFDLDLSYDWHQFNGDSLLEGLNYDHSITFMMGQELDKFYLSTSINYTIGASQNVFFDLGLSRYFQIEGLIFDNDALLINPSLSVSFGTDYWLYEDMTFQEKTTTFIDLKNAGYSYETISFESFDIFIPVSYGVKNTYFTVSWLYKIPSQKYDYLGWGNRSGFMFSLTYFLNFQK